MHEQFLRLLARRRELLARSYVWSTLRARRPPTAHGRCTHCNLASMLTCCLSCGESSCNKDLYLLRLGQERRRRTNSCTRGPAWCRTMRCRWQWCCTVEWCLDVAGLHHWPSLMRESLYVFNTPRPAVLRSTPPPHSHSAQPNPANLFERPPVSRFPKSDYGAAAKTAPLISIRSPQVQRMLNQMLSGGFA